MPTNPQSHLIDLRSDTVTRPTEEMYEAMRAAPLGDDVLGDDPTVLQLEQLAALMVGKEAAVFVPSGTMGNQIALACHCKRGDAILVEEEAHILYYEVGAPAIVAGAVTWTLPSQRGILEPQTIEARILKASLHTPGTTLLCLENTHNRAGGAVVPIDKMAAYRQICNTHGLAVHLDGARVFNAAIALQVKVQEITRHVDSVSICLSKGLGSPVGSVLCGSQDFIASARIWRKRLGGGMRQAGLLAACGVVSLSKMICRLAEDHAHARSFGAALQNLTKAKVDESLIQTNMVLMETSEPAGEVSARLKELGLLCLPSASHRLRFVFHADIDATKTDSAIAIAQKLLS